MSHQPNIHNQPRSHRPELRITSRGKLAALGLTAVTAVGAYHVGKGVEHGLSQFMGDGPTTQQLERMPTRSVAIPAGAGADYAINKVDPQIYANGQVRTELENIIDAQTPGGVLQPDEVVAVPVIKAKS